MINHTHKYVPAFKVLISTSLLLNSVKHLICITINNANKHVPAATVLFIIPLLTYNTLGINLT